MVDIRQLPDLKRSKYVYKPISNDKDQSPPSEIACSFHGAPMAGSRFTTTGKFQMNVKLQMLKNM